jgi:hypothetical protein
MIRKGMTKGSGKKGYYNIIGVDPKVHSMSAKGMKQPQKTFSIGDKVQSKFTQAKGTVISKTPFGVEYKYKNKKYVKLDNPNYWQKGGKLDIIKYKKWQADHPNFMSPNIIKLITKGNNSIIEVSQGRGFEGQKIYGVSIINQTKDGFETDQSDLNQMFENKDEAINYAKSISKQKGGKLDDLTYNLSPETEAILKKEEDAAKPIGTKIGEFVRDTATKTSKYIKEKTPKVKKFIQEESLATKDFIVEKYENYDDEQKAIKSMSDRKLKELTVREGDTNFFSNGNKYKTELLDRIQRRKEIDKDIKEAMNK